jgi:hypothetical protein
MAYANMILLPALLQSLCVTLITIVKLVLKIVTSQDSHHKFMSDEKLTIGKVMLNHDGMYYVPCVTHLYHYSRICKPLVLLMI